MHCNLNSVSSSFDGLPSCGQLCQESTSIGSISDRLSDAVFRLPVARGNE